jgi:hypothetical protein
MPSRYNTHRRHIALQKSEPPKPKAEPVPIEKAQIIKKDPKTIILKRK